MDKTKATVTSGVKNWYINFFYRYFWILWDANWCQNNDFFLRNRSFRIQGFPAPNLQTSS